VLTPAVRAPAVACLAMVGRINRGSVAFRQSALGASMAQAVERAIAGAAGTRPRLPSSLDCHLNVRHNSRFIRCPIGEMRTPIIGKHGTTERTNDQCSSRHYCGSRADRCGDACRIAANLDGAAESTVGRIGAMGGRDRVSGPDHDLRRCAPLVRRRLHGSLDHTGHPFPQAGKGAFATDNSACGVEFPPLTAGRYAKRCCGHPRQRRPPSCHPSSYRAVCSCRPTASNRRHG
jgi:hypothetical protein